MELIKLINERETLQRQIRLNLKFNGQDVFIFQSTGLKKFESLISGMSDNKVGKELKRHNSQANRSQH